MNKNNYRLVFSRLRNMLVAVEETATATGKEAGESSVRSGESYSANFTLRQIAFAALMLLGVLPSWSSAQIVPGGANAPGVIATQNGLPQVNINRPSSAGVSMNTYGQFDVQKNGAILNNSPTIVQTQQAGMINGNPNFGPGQSARVIVNQVNSSAASQINGRLEVAGQRAEVVIANGSGISVNGGGFINTSRAILTTGTPNFAPDGSLSGFNVTHGNISVQGAGLNAADIDQVDLIARAVQANAAIYAKNLNVVTGANSVNHDTLNATPIAGEGPTPGVSIDVSNLGGMYSNRIVLVGTENGVGVSTKGVLAAQAGDLILTTQGKLVLAGQTNASGNIALSARDGIENSGTSYAQQNVSATTSGTLTNSGVLAAQQNTTVHAGSIASTGTLGAGVNPDGTIANEGDLSISASGAITATGQNEAGGNTNISGASVNLAGSNTSANGTLALVASGGDLNVVGASTTAGGALIANASGTLINDSGKMSGASVQATAANVSNRSGQLVSGSTLNVSAASGMSNQGGTMQSAGALAVNAGSLDNTAGRIVSLNGDGLNIASDALNNGANGTIGTNGALNVHAGTLSNQGQLTAAGNAAVHAQSIDNHTGSIVAGHVLDVTAASELNNSGATLSGSTTTVSGSSIDNSNGNIEGDALAVSATGNIANQGGKLTQFGTADQAIQAGGTLDNTSGAIASNANNLRIDGQTITNDKGNIQHAGTGTLAVNANGGLSNVAGNVVTNGALAAQAAGRMNNTQGAIQASRRADVNAASLDNTAGRIVSLNSDGLSITAANALNNGAGGTIGTNGALDVIAGTLANQSKLTATGDVQVRAQSFDNHAGAVTAGGALTTTIAGALNNTAGTLSGTATTVSAASIDNTNGDIEGDVLAISATGNIANHGGKLTQFSTTDQAIQAGGTLDNTSGTIATNANNLNVSAQSIANDNGTLQHAGTGTLRITTPGGVSNGVGQLVTNGAMALRVGSALNNISGTIQAAHGASVDADSLDNTAGRIVSLNDDRLSVTAADALNNGTGGTIGTNGTLDVSAGTLANQGTLTAAKDAWVRAKSIDNHAGTVTAGGALGVATGSLNNTAGTLSGGATAISAASVDNTNGDINGDALALSISGDFTNRNGALTQYSTADQSIQVGGTLDNDDGMVATNAQDLSVSAQSIINDHGTIQHAGTGTLAMDATGIFSNIGGNARTNGALTVKAASLDNTSGTLLAMRAAQIAAASGIVNRDGSLYSGNGLAVSTQGDIDNTHGSAQTSGDLTVEAGGTITNAQGTSSANGAHGTTSVSAASIDNAGGKLTNAGDGATTISASNVTNTNGTLGGNGDVTVTAQTLSNVAGANLVAGGAANLNVTQRVDNSGGTLFGGTALNLNQVNAELINDNGAMLGGQDVSVNVASIANAAGAIRANRDIAASGAVSGDGDMIAGRDPALAVVGDYTNTATNTLHADGNMTVSATGTLTNTGTLAANGALTASGANVVNAADGDINSSSTTVNASNAMSNAGRIEGDTVTTNSAMLANTGAIIGNDVTANASDITNTGSAAVIAGANSVHLYASDSVTNADGALIYSLGNLEIAKEGTRDASGMLANQTGTLTNSAASIEAEGDIDIAARTVNNVRTGVLTEAGTPQDAGSTTLTIWTAGLTASRMGYYYSTLYPEWRWDDGAIGTGVIGHLMKPITVKLPASQVTNLDPNAQSFSLTVPLTDTYSALAGSETSTRTITNNATQWYNSLTDNGNGTYSITFWPDFDPNKNIRPDQVRVNETLGDDNHDYVEMQHTTQTTTTTDQLVSAGNAAAIQAQGAIRINADNGSISNDSSTMAAGGDLVRRATGGSVNDTGTVLQQTHIDTAMSDWYWHQKTGSDNDYQRNVSDGISQATTTVNALPAIATSNQTVQTDAQTISINSVNRQGQTVNGSGVTGGSADGTQLGGITGQSSSTGVSGAQTGRVSGQGAPSGNVSGLQADNVSGQSSNLQTVGGASGGIPNLKLPVSGLYSYNTAPDATYLIVTDPRFTQYSSFISSDYMLGQLGLDPSKTEKRLGDGTYEQTLIRNQVTQLTGRTFLTGYASNLDEYTALMNNGVAYAKEFGLQPGLALTSAQIQQLTTDMVWLVSQDVTLPDGSHQTVLVPQVYLAQSSTVDLTHSGALVAGNAVNLNASGDVTNSGHVTSNLATTIIGNNVVNGGVIGSSGMTAIQAVQDVRNTSGRIGGGDVVVQAGRDIINETQTYGVSQEFSANSLSGRVTGTGINAIGTISAMGNAAVIAGRDVSLNGALIQTGGDTAIAAGRDLTLGTTTLIATRDVQTRDGLNGSHDAVTQNLGSAIVTGGSLATVSGRDTTLTGATVSANGDTTMIAGGNLLVTAAKDTQTHSEQSMGGKQAQHISSSYDEAVQGSNIDAGGNVTLAAGQNGSGNLAILGSAVAADTGGVKLISTGDVTIGSVSETHHAQNWSHNEHSGFLSKETVNDTNSSHQVIEAGSTVSGDTVTGAAGHDITISGSTIAATHDVTLAAVNNLTVNPTKDTSESRTFHEDKKSGFGTSGGIGISYGNVNTKDTAHDSSVTNNASLVGSTDGSVNLSAGNDLNVTGSDLIAAQNVTGTGANVIIDAATDTTHSNEAHEVSKSGFTLAIKAPVIDAIFNTIDQARAGSRSQDDRAAALHGMAAASRAIDSAGAADAALGALADGKKPEGKIELSYGSSNSKSTYNEDSTTHRGSSVTARGTAAFVATGDGTQGSGNVTIAGSNVNANDVILAAKNQVNLINTTDTDSTRSSNESSSASVGVSYGTQGFGVDASMSKAHGDGNSDAAMQNNTHVTAANTVTIISGGDTNIIGANVNGHQVNADVGGNLNIASIQDTMSSAAHQESTSGGFAISQGGGGGGSASFSHTNANANGSYAGVNEQAGIQAGDGGFNISVHGNTDLKGAVIASDADASKNNLSTGTLSVSDIQNQSSYNAHSGGFSVGVTTGNGGANYSTSGPTSGTNAGGGSPMLSQNDSGSDSATTRSGISAGTINVTDGANQTQDIASLNRDTSNTNGAVAKLPDVNNLLDRQADMMSAASAAGEAVSRRIGDYAKSKYDEAAANHDEAGMDAWREGGNSRAVMQAAGAALVTGLAGGNALGGAVGAGIASIAAGQWNKLSGAIADSDPTGNAGMNTALGNIVSNVIATGAGAAVGGNAGAFSAYDADRFNRQLHPEEKTLAKQIADKSGGKYTAAQVEDQMRLMSATVNGTVESGAAVTLIGQLPSDAGAGWLGAGQTSDGKSILAQTTSAVDPQLQDFIVKNYASAGGGVPVVTGYTASPTQPQIGPQYGSSGMAGSVCPRGDCGVVNMTVNPMTRDQLADSAASVSTAAGRFGAVTGAAAAIPTPYSPAFATSAFAATVAGWIAGGLEQAVRPNPRSYISGGLVDIGNYLVSDRFPMAGPAINEVGEAIKGSSWMDQFNKEIKK